MTVPILLATVLAGATGATARYLVSLATPTPWAVLAVNVAGSLVGGFAVAALAGDIQVIVLAGFCGGLTTFSALSVETVDLVMRKRVRVAVVSVAANLVVGVAAAALGFWLGSL